MSETFTTPNFRLQKGFNRETYSKFSPTKRLQQGNIYIYIYLYILCFIHERYIYNVFLTIQNVDNNNKVEEQTHKRLPETLRVDATVFQSITSQYTYLQQKDKRRNKTSGLKILLIFRLQVFLKEVYCTPRILLPYIYIYISGEKPTSPDAIETATITNTGDKFTSSHSAPALTH